jgi:hypothetical protein
MKKGDDVVDDEDDEQDRETPTLCTEELFFSTQYEVNSKSN